MHVVKLSLINFKNYKEITLDFSDQFNCIVGLNGAGKTNLLDAIHYLSLTKGAFNSVDSQNIRFGEDYFMIKGSLDRDGLKEVLCSFQRGKKKVIKVDKSEHEKLAHHIGLFPVVMIAPDDTEIVTGSSEVRRKFFDSIISQMDSDYLNDLVKYNHFIKQRNAMLKKFNEGLRFDLDLLEPYDKQLIHLNNRIYSRRLDFMSEFNPVLSDVYYELAAKQETIGIQYDSQVGDSFIENFHSALDKDRILERTTMGIHRDDYKFTLKGKGVKKFGSQGQRKSFLLALKLAQYRIILGFKGFKPVLLLDDIFDKLDLNRIKQLLSIISSEDFGQIIITDAREERTALMLKELNLEAKFHMISERPS